MSEAEKTMTVLEFRDKLVSEIALLDAAEGVGQTGDINAKLIPGQSDIDMFVLCSRIPEPCERQALYTSRLTGYSSLEMAVCSGGIWGHGDILVYQDIEVMPMYFTMAEMTQYAAEVLCGRKLDKEGRFYPMGRLASIASINILWERTSAWSDIVDMVKHPPKELFLTSYRHHMNRVLDEEDLGRSLLRKDVLFYHQVLEEALDHFLQALYALNERYFPSRKRSESAIASFAVKPADCYDRLLTIVETAARTDTIEKSIAELRSLAHELSRLSM